MATPRVKTTYALDRDTVQRLEDMARRWGVSKSEALRRAIRAASGPIPAGTDPARALDELQRALALSHAHALSWARRSRAERPASAARRERRAE